MLDLANDIRSLSDFKRNTVDLLDRLRKTGHPLVLTINGKAELVVQDATAYQHVYRVFFMVDHPARDVCVVHVRRGARERPRPDELKGE